MRDKSEVKRNASREDFNPPFAMGDVVGMARRIYSAGLTLPCLTGLLINIILKNFTGTSLLMTFSGMRTSGRLTELWNGLKRQRFIWIR